MLSFKLFHHDIVVVGVAEGGEEKVERGFFRDASFFKRFEPFWGLLRLVLGLAVGHPMLGHRIPEVCTTGLPGHLRFTVGLDGDVEKPRFLRNCHN